MKKVAHLQKTSVVMTQDVVHVLVLIALSLLFCFVPRVSLGQALPGNDAFSALDSMSTLAPPPIAAPSEPAAFLQAAPAISEAAIPFGGTSLATPNGTFPIAQPEPPVPPSPAAPVAAPAAPVAAPAAAPIARAVPKAVAATANPAAANPLMQSTPQQQPLLRSPQFETAAPVDHPFRQYLGIPSDPQTKITGKPMTVTELFTGTRSSAVRCQLLQAYWELSGLLAIYHFRCEAERLAVAGAQQEGMTTLLSEQRRTAEIEFIKQQWVLAELLKQYKGRTLREVELPIPADYPLYPRYQTHAGKIARTERTQYLGRMIPIQEQLIESKNGTWRAASEMATSGSQPFFAVASQRTMAFLGLTEAIIEYNKMIAEYALETIPPNASQQQLVGAVVRLPRSGTAPIPPPQTLQTAASGITQALYNAPMGMAAPSAEPIARDVQTTYPPVSPPAPPAIPGNEPPKSETLSEPSSLVRDLM